jgi:hypothetical protein
VPVRVPVEAELADLPVDVHLHHYVDPRALLELPQDFQALKTDAERLQWLRTHRPRLVASDAQADANAKASMARVLAWRAARANPRPRRRGRR